MNWYGCMRVMAVALAVVNRAGAVSEKDLQDAAVKIFTEYDEHDFYRPWQMRGKSSKTGSGCVIEGNRILTNAHVVADQTFIQVERAGMARKYVAAVQFVGHECDLALLTVVDPAFFEGARPMKLGELPLIRDKVAVYGFPTGGTRIAITEGVVSRVENLYYSHSQAELLACQIDAPINPGSSGGPVVSDGKVAGVAFQSMAGENIGYMVPAPVIRHFLDDIGDGRYDGFPALGLAYQKMENPDMRGAFHMGEGQTGILVNRAFPRSPCRGLVDSGDVILSVDGFAVANDATVEFREGERTLFEYTVQRHLKGDSVDIEVLRAGKRRTARIALDIVSNEWCLVPRQSYDTPPRYYIAGGLVFVPLTSNLLRTWGNNWLATAPRGLVHYYFAQPEDKRDEVVVLTQILSDQTNMGYDDHVFSVMTSVNGTAIRNLEELKSSFEANQGAHHELVDEDGYRIVLSTRSAAENKPRIFKRYRILFGQSEGLGVREESP